MNALPLLNRAVVSEVLKSEATGFREVNATYLFICQRGSLFWRENEATLFWILYLCTVWWQFVGALHCCPLQHTEVRGQVKFNSKAGRRSVSCWGALSRVCACEGHFIFPVKQYYPGCALAFLLLLLYRDHLRSWAVPVSTIWLLVPPPPSLFAHTACSFPVSHNHML